MGVSNHWGLIKSTHLQNTKNEKQSSVYGPLAERVEWQMKDFANGPPGQRRIKMGFRLHLEGTQKREVENFGSKTIVMTQDRPHSKQ
jgi:anaerobic selenocysteine-containing dehydrogenase